MSVSALAPVKRLSAPAREQTVGEIIHELRQPLSSIEAIAYYLEMTLPVEHAHARYSMRLLQGLVERSNEILDQRR